MSFNFKTKLAHLNTYIHTYFIVKSPKGLFRNNEATNNIIGNLFKISEEHNKICLLVTCEGLPTAPSAFIENSFVPCQSI